MQNNSANKGIFHFAGARIWVVMPVYQYQNCFGYNIDNMYISAHIITFMPFLTSNFLLKFEYCENQKSSLGETKTISHNFLRALF